MNNDEKTLFSMIDKRVSKKEEYEKFRWKVFTGPIEYNKYEVIGHSIKFSKEIRKKDYTNVYKYFQNKAFKLNKKQIEKCIKKLDELIL